jgi:hypothetical protein
VIAAVDRMRIVIHVETRFAPVLRRLKELHPEELSPQFSAGLERGSFLRS